MGLLKLELCKQDKMSELLLAATLIMSNKVLDAETMTKIWEELKMVNIFAFAHEKGVEEGLEKGLEKGLETPREMIIEALHDTIGMIPEYITKQIHKISQKDTLKKLLKQANRCKDLAQFEQMLHIATTNRA